MSNYNFYNYINILDKTECNTIAVAPIPNHGLGKTINDRLKRASHNDEWNWFNEKFKKSF